MGGRFVPSESQSAIASAYAEMLMRQRWAWFATLTFRGSHEGARSGVHPEKADKAYRFFVSCLNREIFGKNWHRKPHGGVQWARGQEFHKSGKIHFHAVLAAPEVDLNALARRMDWVDWWWKEFGIARIEPPQSQQDICSYVSKYVAKDGEVDFSPNFGRYQLPQFAFATQTAPPVASFKRAPGGDGEPRVGSQEGTPRGASRCLTLPVCLQKPLPTLITNTRQEKPT